MERITELFSLTISKGKLELMDNSSEMTRSLSRLFYHEVDYNHIFDENLSNNEKGNGFIKKCAYKKDCYRISGWYKTFQSPNLKTRSFKS